MILMGGVPDRIQLQTGHAFIPCALQTQDIVDEFMKMLVRLLQSNHAVDRAILL